MLDGSGGADLLTASVGVVEVHDIAVASNLEVQVHTGDVASGAHAADELVALDALAYSYIEPAEVGVPRLVAGSVPDVDHVAVAALDASKGHSTCVSGPNLGAGVVGDVDAVVVGVPPGATVANP